MQLPSLPLSGFRYLPLEKIAAGSIVYLRAKEEFRDGFTQQKEISGRHALVVDGPQSGEKSLVLLEDTAAHRVMPPTGSDRMRIEYTVVAQNLDWRANLTREGLVREGSLQSPHRGAICVTPTGAAWAVTGEKKLYYVFLDTMQLAESLDRNVSGNALWSKSWTLSAIVDRAAVEIVSFGNAEVPAATS